MTAGKQYNADSINAQAAQAVIGVRDALAYAKEQYDWLNALGSEGIQQAPLVGQGTQISSEDATTILAALTDLAGLAQFFSGQAVTLGFGAQHVSDSYDFMTFGRLLTNGA
jgi:hypothetical protein